MRKRSVALAVASGLMFFAACGVFLFSLNPLCYFKGRYKTGECIEDSLSGAMFRVLGRHNHIQVGCVYELEVLQPGTLDNVDQLNPFVTLGMADVRDPPPATVDAEIKSLDEMATHQAMTCKSGG